MVASRRAAKRCRKPAGPSVAARLALSALLAGGVICIALAVAGFFALNRQIADFQRVPVPGQGGVTFAQPGGYVLYIEEPGQCCSINVASDTSSRAVSRLVGAGPPAARSAVA